MVTGGSRDGQSEGQGTPREKPDWNTTPYPPPAHPEGAGSSGVPAAATGWRAVARRHLGREARGRGPGVTGVPGKAGQDDQHDRRVVLGWRVAGAPLGITEKGARVPAAPQDRGRQQPGHTVSRSPSCQFKATDVFTEGRGGRADRSSSLPHTYQEVFSHRWPESEPQKVREDCAATEWDTRRPPPRSCGPPPPAIRVQGRLGRGTRALRDRQPSRAGPAQRMEPASPREWHRPRAETGTEHQPARLS